LIDLHCHILPGVDDGPRDWNESIDLCRSMVKDGITLAVATPHLIDGVYDNRKPKVDALVEELRQRLADAGVALRIESGAEVDLSSRLVSEPCADLPVLAGGKAVLLEMPVAVIPHAMNEIIFAVTSRGLLPVLAHPERNELLQRDTSLARAWVEAGAALQIDGDSLLGVWGRGAKRCAEGLLCAGLVHALASDAHSCERRPPRLTRALEAAKEMLGAEAEKLVTDGPASILDGRCPPTPLYRISRRRARSAGDAPGNLLQRVARQIFDRF
jgi:protein-tyrosine phosphatase